MQTDQKKKKRAIVDDSETESEADTRSRRRRRVDESDSDSDAAEDLSSSSSDDDEDSGNVGRVKEEMNMRLDAAKCNGSDDDSDGESADDGAPNGTYRVGVVVQVKDEQTGRDLFGDDDDDDEDEDDEDLAGANNEYNNNEEEDEEDLVWKSDGENARAYGDESVEKEPRAASSNARSFTDELLMNSESNGDEHLVENSAEAAVDKPLRLSGQEVFDTRLLLRNIFSNLSTRERDGIRRGVRVVGPPIQEPNAHVDEFKRKFRWPVRMINLPARDFSQDPMEIFNDYELPVKASDSSPRNTPSEQEHRIHGSQSARTASAFAQLLSPVVEAAAASAQQLLKKRKRLHSDPEGSREGDNVSAKKLMNLARIGTRFADRFLDSMIRDNAAVLQGEDKDYLQRSWNPLPVTRKPVANWRFAFENALKHHTGNGASQDAVCPPLRQTTLVRIRDRLKKLYSLPWTTEDNELLARVDHTVDKSPSKALLAAPGSQTQSLDTQPSEEARILML